MKKTQTNKLNLEKITISKLETTALNKIVGGGGGGNSGEIGGQDTEPPGYM